MYQVGQRVMYGIHGVCQILDVEIKTIDRKKISYFVLEPLDQPGARFYIPSEKPAALAKLSPLLELQELEALLSCLDKTKAAWISDENHRKLYYRELLGSVDRKAMLDMICALQIHRKEQLEMGKKFHLCDENFLRDAEKLLCCEFALVWGISREQAAARLEQLVSP